MMKKRIMTILAGFFALNAGFAHDITVAVENPALSGLLAQLQTSIKAKPELLDHYLNVMQGIATQQEQELHAALQAQDQQKITTLTQNREVMRQVNAVLYDAKEQQTQKKAEFAGNLYTFKSQALMPRLSMSWGDKEYFAFPSNQTYVQLNWSQNISGEVKNLISAEYQGKKYLPKYYYAGENTLQDLAWKEAGDKMGKNNGETQASYLFFDFPLHEEKELKNLTFKVGDTVIQGSKLFIQPAFSPLYTVKEHNSAFAFCKAVAERKGEQVKTKEYSEQDCEAAVQLRFSPDLHTDILDYAKHLYWQEKNLLKD